MTIDLPATITAVGAVVTAIGVILLGYWAYRAKERASVAAEKAVLAADKAKVAADDIVIVKGQIRTLGEAIDGRLSKLLEVSIAAARAEGVSAGEQAQRDRSAEKQP